MYEKLHQTSALLILVQTFYKLGIQCFFCFPKSNLWCWMGRDDEHHCDGLSSGINFLSKVPSFYSIHWSFIINWDLFRKQISCLMPILSRFILYCTVNKIFCLLTGPCSMVALYTVKCKCQYFRYFRDFDSDTAQ